MTRVSVIIPVYNVEKFLEKCLNSVIIQTFDDIEIICVNDGSTDSSADILARFAQNDERVKVITQSNQGASKARNVALEAATGEFVYFLDSDDYIEPTLIEKCVHIMDCYDVDFINFDSEEFGDKNKRLHKYLKNKRSGLVKIDYNQVRKINIYIWNKFYRKTLIDDWNLKFIENLIYEDIFFNWVYFLKSRNAYLLDETLHHYRVHDESIMKKSESNKDFQNAIHHLYNFKALLDYFVQDIKEFKKNKKSFFKILNGYYKRTLEMSPKGSFKEVTDVYKHLHDKLLKVSTQKHNIFNFVFLMQFKYEVAKNRWKYN